MNKQKQGFSPIIIFFVIFILITIIYFLAKQTKSLSSVISTGLPIPTQTSTLPPNVEKIIVKVGEQEGSFLLQRVNSESADGLWYQAYPVATLKGSPKTLQVGDDIGYRCAGVSEKLISIDSWHQTITFAKIVGKAPPGGCPI